MEEKTPRQAAEIWMELLTTDPENANLNYKLGLCYFSSYNQEAKAQPFLEKASQLRKSDSYGGFNSAGYDPFEPKERNAPVEIGLLPRAFLPRAEKFDLADQFYQKFLDEADPRHSLRPAAARGKEQTVNARELRKTPLNYQDRQRGPCRQCGPPGFPARCFPWTATRCSTPRAASARIAPTTTSWTPSRACHTRTSM